VGAGGVADLIEVEEAWVEVLAHIYRAVDWRKVARSRSPYDIFEHRLSFARYERSVPDVIQRLCNTLSLQAPPLPLDKVEFLRQNEVVAMDVLRRWTKLLTLKAAQRAREMRKAKREKERGGE